jgi:hypothetical protein
VVPAPVAKVYEHVTAYGPEGPVNEEQFRQRYSEDIRHTTEGYVYTEDVRRYPDDPAEIITWRCTFEYPSSRIMTALDSDWSDRRDVFEPLADATRWTVRWSTHGSLIHGLFQLLFFRLTRGKRLKRTILDPVVRHFEAD